MDEVTVVGERIGRHFARSEPRDRAVGSVRGLLSDAERSSGWHLAEYLGDTTPDGVPQLLARAGRGANARDDLLGYAAEHLGDPGGVLIVDATGFRKKGTKSVGVARPYSGTAGRVENGQVGVFVGCATARGRAPLGRALDLPNEWAGDADWRKAAGMPKATAFAAEIVLARRRSPVIWSITGTRARVRSGIGTKRGASFAGPGATSTANTVSPSATVAITLALRPPRLRPRARAFADRPAPTFFF